MSFSQSINSDVVGFFFKPGTFLTSKNISRDFLRRFFLILGICTLMMLSRTALSGKAIKWKKHLLKKASGKSFSLLEVMITSGRFLALMVLSNS